MKKPKDEHPPTISEIPQFKDAATGIAIGRVIAKWGPRVRWLLPLFGVKLAEFDKSVEEVKASLLPVERFIDIPDRFNALYARCGWIAASQLSMDLMIEAVRLGEAGDIPRGEQLLIEQFTEERLEMHLRLLDGVKHFRDRRELARLTKVDYLEGRYHACVPNLLMLIDGLACDASGSSESFFAKATDLSAWNLIEGHPSGLPALSRMMQEKRPTRNTDELTIPYRHGILHGRDLGFANKTVAAKCWAALVAVGEWARAVQNGKRSAPPPEPEVGLLDSFRRLAHTVQQTERLKQWRPRNPVPGQSIPETGPPEAYPESTPERALAAFLYLWTKGNYGGMAKLMAIGPNKVDYRVRAGDIHAAYKPLRLLGYAFTSIEERGPMVAHIEVTCSFDGDDSVSFGFLLVFENEEGDYNHADLDKGTWRLLNDWSVRSYIPVSDEPEDDESSE